MNTKAEASMEGDTILSKLGKMTTSSTRVINKNLILLRLLLMVINLQYSVNFVSFSVRCHQ